MSPANPLSRLSAIIRAPIMTHTAHSTESDWFLPYDGPVEPPPPPVRHPFAASEISQPRPIPAKSRATVLESRSRANSKTDDVRSRSRSRSVDTKRKSQRSYVALDQKAGGVGAYPAPADNEREHASVHSDHTFGTHSAHTMGHVRGRSSIGIGHDRKQSFPWSDDSTVSTGGKHSDPPVVFANHPFRMHTTSPPPRTHTSSTPLTTTTPWVRTITASPAPPDPAPMRKRTMTYQPGLVTTFGSSAESRVGYRESGAFVDLDERERERIRPTLLPPSLSLLGKGSTDQQGPAPDEHGHIQKQPPPTQDRELYPGLRQPPYDLRSHPYAIQSAPVRETRFGSASTNTTTTTGGSSKPPVPPRSSGMKLKSSLKASMSTPELRIRIPSTVPPSGLSTGQTPSTDHPPQSHVGLGARPRHPASSVTTAASTTLEARSICDALIFTRPRLRVASHEIAPARSLHDDESKRASMRVGDGGLKGLVCFPRKASRDFTKDKGKGKEKEKEKEAREFQTLEEVVQQGVQLEKEREEWNAIGQGSLFNSRARSLSRSQTKLGNGPRAKRRETVSVSDSSGGTKVWGTIKIKRSVEMLAASAFAQGQGPAPSVASSKRPSGHGAQPSVSTHNRHASGSVASRAHSRTESWGQRVVCGSRSGSSLGDETPGTGQNTHSSEGLSSTRAPVDNYPVVDIRPVPVGNTNRARAPPAQGSVGFTFGTRRTPHSSPSKSQSQSQKPPAPSPVPGDSDSVIGLALSSPSGTLTPLVLPNHPFAQRAGAYPTDPAPLPPPGPETVATRHRHPPRSSGSTERARLDDPKTVPGPSKLESHPFVARMSTHSGEVQRMFETAMLTSAGGQGEFAFDARRESGDSGLGSSVHELVGSSSSAPVVRGSAFGPPAGLEAMLERSPAVVPIPVPAPIPETQPAPASSISKVASPQSSVQSPWSLMDSLSPASRVMTRTSSGMIDPSLMSPQSRSHESSSSSFSSPRPLNSIDDIESLRDIFYRPSPDRRAGSLTHHSQDGSPANDPVLDEQDEEEEEEQEANEDWTFGRRPFELGSDSNLIWRRRREGDDDAPLRINIAPGTPSPPPPGAVPESVHDSDSRSERSVGTTSSQYATNENVTFGVVPSARMDALSVNVVSPRQSAALSLIDMYDYEVSLSSNSPNTPQNFHSLPSPSTLSPTGYPRESYYTSSSVGVRPGMDHLLSGFPTPPMDSAVTPLSSSVLSSYFTVDTHASSRRETD
ncbi:unnamed protein product [Rhizoctonia solani]|uniref:Uncharacterized protein n=1 Tax=Rhizoctonia solani TaxID=456999 RepID=A0A8H2XJY9_9AGAM|nr:unnamed protein product [Rhizoctonia solani]